LAATPLCPGSANPGAAIKRLAAEPDAALPVFRKWFKQDYLPTRFPRYILGKANLLGGQLAAQQIASLYQPKQIR
jgi:hypothetical protein